MYCLFCNQPVKDNLDHEKDIICSFCVITLLKYSQEELVQGHLKALELGLLNKAKALESFIEKEILDGFKSDRLPNGNRSNGIFGLGQEGTTNKLKTKGKDAICKGNKTVKNVLRSRPVELVEG